MSCHDALNPAAEPTRHMDFCQTLLDALPEGLFVHSDGVILYANDIAARIVGARDRKELVNHPLTSFFPPDSWKRTLESIVSDSGPKGNGWPAEMELIRTDDRKVTIESLTTPVSFNAQNVLCTLFRDISRRKESEERIRHQANYDNLTKLPNRTLFMDRLNRELIRAKRTKSRVALMFIDLDRFKWVNDTLGHAAGDELLREVSRRLKNSLRQSDTVARMGGDEFTAILPDMARGPHAERVAAEILHQLTLPFILEGQEAFISGSLGISVFPDDATELDALLKNADTAMYRAKTEGRNAYRFFTPDMHAEALERMELEKDLHRALERRELQIHYQPIVDLKSGSIIGAESFLRWIHPRRGNISPAIFVPLAEEIGMIAHFTEWAIRTACAQAHSWREQFALEHFFISVNLSCTRCRELSTDDKIPAILQETGLSPTALVLEITENILSEDEPRAMAMLKRLVDIGVDLWLDDFGTGSSSLSVLKRLPVNGIKIDRAFVADDHSDPETVVLVEAIMSLAKSLKRMVIGEGVENLQQARFLIQRGCPIAQGYLFSRALQPEEFAKIILKVFPL
ncbi:MAG: EAL domain-containing protein [Magnetococcales bacterium]|nr:EAL domain-containing protein [Magnetococcales bacterium]MBF0150122.1 EAL domain-containing protein [Magnetococcales bacterium]MBF0172852.1 EAL domain-containing protein [Magnetococcales bacterium]MBF0348079.1 EAL domain-containing protein [Magnetococcales bacterium]MBF0631253.1 EAL domain-containing protein [Magnetococcales bacterium]